MNPTEQLIKQDGNSVPVSQISESREANALLCADFFSDLTERVELITPALTKLFWDFSHLSKGETIMGCASQSEWAKKYTGKTAEALRLMLKRALPGFHKKKTPPNRPQLPEGNRDSAKPTLLVSPVPAVELVQPKIVEEGPSVGVLDNPFPIAAPISLDPVEPRVQEPMLHTPPCHVISEQKEQFSDFHVQKVEADLVFANSRIAELKRLVDLVLQGKENLRYLPNETVSLYERLMG